MEEKVEIVAEAGDNNGRCVKRNCRSLTVRDAEFSVFRRALIICNESLIEVHASVNGVSWD